MNRNEKCADRGVAHFLLHTGIQRKIASRTGGRPARRVGEGIFLARLSKSKKVRQLCTHPYIEKRLQAFCDIIKSLRGV